MVAALRFAFTPACTIAWPDPRMLARLILLME